jgi:VWFA-related protein
MNSSSRRGLALLSLVLAISPIASSQELPKPDPNEPTIRVNVTRVNVGVTVTDSRGRFVKGLRPEDFRVMDNGQEQAIISFTSTEEPVRLVFLIESGIQNYFLAKFGMSSFAAADALLASISPSDQVAIVTYSNQARVALNFTSEKAQVRHALKALHSQLLTSRTGSTSLNLSSSVAATLNWLAQVPGRKTIVLLSTGFDMFSAGNLANGPPNASDVGGASTGGFAVRRFSQTPQGPKTWQR